MRQLLTGSWSSLTSSPGRIPCPSTETADIKNGHRHIKNAHTLTDTHTVFRSEQLPFSSLFQHVLAKL